MEKVSKMALDSNVYNLELIDNDKVFTIISLRLITITNWFSFKQSQLKTLQLTNLDMRFTAFGFLDIDIKLLKIVFGGFATYMVIFLQFQYG